MTVAVQMREKVSWNDPVFDEDEIIEAYSGFVEGLTRKIHAQMQWTAPIEDSIQEGFLVLIRLIRTGAYVPNRGSEFKTFLGSCLWNRFSTLASNNAKFTEHMKLHFERLSNSRQHLRWLECENEERELEDLIEVLELKVSETARKVLERRLSEQSRVTLSRLCEELECSMKTAKNAAAEIRRVFRELTEEIV